MAEFAKHIKIIWSYVYVIFCIKAEFAKRIKIIRSYFYF
jgi:hypothetical protein